MPDNPSVLSVKALAKTFSRTVAVAGVSFNVSTREVVALAGGNGSGKTTLLRMIAGSMVPDAGYTEWNGQKLAPGNRHAARLNGIEMVFQDGALCPDCSVLENLFLGQERMSRLGFLYSGDMRRDASRMIERYAFPIPGLDVTPARISGGQQKAVAIGRALLSRPRLLLLDEPTAGLAVKEQETILRTIGELKSDGVGIVLCTHSPDEILAVADRVLVLHRGELVQDRGVIGLSRPELAVLMSN